MQEHTNYILVWLLFLTNGLAPELVKLHESRPSSWHGDATTAGPLSRLFNFFGLQHNQTFTVDIP